MGDPVSTPAHGGVPPVMVIDTSMAMRCFLDPEPNRDAALALLESMKEGHCIGVVPVTWGLEVANVLLGKVKSKILSQEDMEKIKVELTKLPFMSDSDTYRHVLTTTLTLAQTHTLKVNDASFLELAQRLGVALATYDKALFEAAVSEGITVFPPQLPEP